MLSHWFSPIDNTLSLLAGKYCQIMYEDGKDFPVLEHTKLAFIGFDKEFSNNVRKQFYSFNNHFAPLQIADLGNLKSLDVEFSIPAIKEILDGGIIPILLGAPGHIIQKLMHRLESDYSTIFHISNRLPDYHSDDKYEILGFQRHLCELDRITQLEGISTSSMSLAKMRAHPYIQEAVLRDANLTHFDGSAIKLSNNPASIESNTSGLTCAESCQVMKNIGGSQNLKLLNITNYEIIDEKRQYASSITIAEMIWYFIEGYHQKLNDHPTITSDQLQRFVIHSLNTDAEMIFVKNETSGRWWFISNGNEEQYHACSHEEYLEAARGDIPDRLLRY